MPGSNKKIATVDRHVGIVCLPSTFPLDNPVFVIKRIMTDILLAYLRPAPALFPTLAISLLVLAAKLLPGANSSSSQSRFPVWQIGWVDILRPILCTPV